MFMSVPISTERRMLTETEFEAVARTHYPELSGQSKDELVSLARLIREYRDKARSITHRRRREKRGKAEPRGAGPAPDEAGTAAKAGIFAAATKRLNREIGRLEKAEKKPTMAESARRALEMKRANRVRHHPSAGRSASRGMRSVPNQGDTVQMDPREIGRVSQSVRNAQVQRDG
jgi:hypothetical protein